MAPDDPQKKTRMGTGVPHGSPVAVTPPPQVAATPAAGTPQPLSTNVPAAGMAAPAPAPPDPYVGQTLVGRYYVEKKLGEGGMGAVYQARHVTLEKEVALKVLHGEFSRKPDLVERFLREAKAASKIRHENVIDISDFGQTPNGAVFFAMEFLKGRDLHDLLARAKINGEVLPWSRTRNIFLQICAALQAAHDKGIVHRDLKPENIYLVEWAGQPDFVKLLDFGIAKMTEVEEGSEERKLTRTGMLFGTPEYMSPEQARGDKADHLVDIYAMGCILYQLITGDVPFRADNFMGILSLHLTEPPPPISPETLARVGAPPQLASVCMKALAKEKADRFQNVRDMAEAILAAEGGKAVTLPEAVAEVGARRRTQWTGRVEIPEDDAPPVAPGKKGGAPVGLIVGGIAVLAAGAIAVVMLTRGGSSTSTAAPAQPTGPAAPEAPLPAQVKIALVSTPAGAQVIDVKTGDDLGQTPFDISMPGSRDAMRVRLVKPGYVTQILQFVPDQDVEHSVELKKATAGAPVAEPEVVVVPQRPHRPHVRPDRPTTRPTKPQTPDKPTVTETKPDKPVVETKPDQPKPVVESKPDKPVTKPVVESKPDKPTPATDKPDKPETKPDKPGTDEPKIKNPFDH